eukprot:1048648-Karenia_brevis.AAC.1
MQNNCRVQRSRMFGTLEQAETLGLHLKQGQRQQKVLLLQQVIRWETAAQKLGMIGNGEMANGKN